MAAGIMPASVQRASLLWVKQSALALSACFPHKEQVLNLQISRPIVGRSPIVATSKNACTKPQNTGSANNIEYLLYKLKMRPFNNFISGLKEKFTPQEMQ